MARAQITGRLQRAILNWLKPILRARWNAQPWSSMVLPAPWTPDWQLVDDATRITRTFKLANFGEAASFVDKLGRLAEEEGHHPDICFGWGHATISLRTKKIKDCRERFHHLNEDRSASKRLGSSTSHSPHSVARQSMPGARFPPIT
jgi:pterin-4a-carbinolamine dehydratase